jgi:hypothetical protein
VKRGPAIADRAAWWNFMLRWAYFFARDFEKAREAVLKIESDAPNDQAYVAMINGQLGHKEEAQAAAAKVLKGNPDWSVELYLDSIGGFARENESDLLIESARKAGLPACMTVAQREKQPAAKKLRACIKERTERT